MNLVTDVFPALALGATETEDSVMLAPPRPTEEKVLGREEWRRILGYGCTITAAVLFAFFYAFYAFYELHLSASQTVSVAFLNLALGQLWHVFNMMPLGAHWLSSQIMRNGFIWGAIVFCIGLLGVAMYWPPAASLLSLGPLTGRPLTLAIGCSLLPLLAGFVVRGIGVQLRPGASTISPVPPNWRARQVVSGCASEIAASVTD